MIAVVIPTFKTGAYFESCLRSLEAQTLPKSMFCVYVALNGPEEPYRSYVGSLLSECSFNYEFFYLKEPGVSGARNLLIEESVEPFVCFVDDDDVLSAGYLESLLQVSDEETIGISNVKAFSISPDLAFPNYIGRSYLRLNDTEGSLYRSRRYFSSPWAKLIHRSIIGDFRFDVSLSKGEDAVFMAEISPSVKSVQKASPEVVYYVRERPNSASRRKPSKIEEVKRFFYIEM